MTPTRPSDPAMNEADALFDMILSMDPKDAPNPAVLERRLDRALAGERRHVVERLQEARFDDEAWNEAVEEVTS